MNPMVFIIAVALLGAVLVWGGARLAERSIQQVEWHTEYLPLDTDYAMTKKAFLILLTNKAPNAPAMSISFQSPAS